MRSPLPPSSFAPYGIAKLPPHFSHFFLMGGRLHWYMRRAHSVIFIFYLFRSRLVRDSPVVAVDEGEKELGFAALRRFDELFVGRV